ncbi:MAG: M48 family metalloprotease [Candidatus Omnitrophica bacterium]|nr:M48 family metalloprotease [Candidatus Omnitrophota bacterium]
MPYSFTKIEEDKTKTISFVFFFLIFVYFAAFWLIAVLSVNFFNYQASPRAFTFHFTVLKFSQTLIIFGFAFIIGFVHWNWTTANLIVKILGVLKAEKLNPKDRYHQMFQNIVDEVSVATGGKKMEAVVIPTMAMNAFALADFSGQAVIGLTEGMLARLTRAQIEAVVGHEAAHIVSGDCLATTITTSLFELFSGVLRGFEAVFRGGGRQGGYSSMRVSARGGAGVIVFLMLIYMLLSVTKMLSQLVRLFISRQREYRADAIAVRLTRDPLSLAEALYAISYRWRGGGLPAQELESIFIVNPLYSAVDEGDGLLSEMFSTHPPIDGRLGILLDMAHSDVELVVKDVERQAQKPRTAVPEIKGSTTQWMAHKDGAWQGPFDMMQMMTLGWMRPETWVQRLGGKKVQMVYQDEDIRHIVSKGEPGKAGGAYQCPKCSLPLNVITYEGTEVHKCSSCRGTLVEEKDVQRIIIRQEVGFSERIKKIAEGISREEKLMAFKKINRDPKTLLRCPKCLHPRTRMMRMFYTEAYRVEVDKCFMCGLIWFDGDELEVVQYMIEHSLNKSRS